MSNDEMIFSKQFYEEIFYNSPFPKLILNAVAPDYTILDVNDAYLSATNTTREKIVGKNVFAVFPGNPSDEDSKNIERTIFSFNQVIQTGKPHDMSNYRYDIPIPGSNDFEERYWTTRNIPVVDDNGLVKYFIHCPSNVTEIIKLQERERQGIEALKAQREQLFSIFMQAPVGIGIFKGPDFVVELINPPLCKLYGKTIEELLGKPIFDVLTDSKGLGFEELLDKVRLTGEPFKGESILVPLKRNNQLENVYVDFVFEPFRDYSGSITGVIAVATEVTSQVKANLKVAEAEERARLAVEAAELGTFDLDLNSEATITSLQFARIFGFEEPVSRKKYVAAIHPEDLQLQEKAYGQALETGKIEYEVRITRPDESIRWIRVDGKLFFDIKNKPARILGTLLDITQQRKANEEQKKLITLVNNSVDLMAILELNGSNSYINEAGKKLLGFTSDAEVKEIPISELHRPEDFEIVEKEVLPSVMDKGQWAGVMNVKHLKTNEVFKVFNNTIRIDDPFSGKPIAVGAVMRDLRPELKAKQALAESEELLRTITTATPTGLWMSDENGFITYVNQTWIDWTGIPLENHLGAEWVNAIYEEDRNFVIKRFKEKLEEKATGDAEFRMKNFDGTIHWYIATGKPQFKEGVFAGYIGACVDISGQKQIQIEKDNFIAIASHELKTPVTSIKAYSQVLEMILADKGESKEAAMVAKMGKQLNRLIDLINDLLDVTKLNAGKLQFNDVAFDLNPMVKDLIEDLQRTTQRHKIVEDCKTTGTVFGDKERIGQVLTNFITNAIKYSPDSDKIIVHTYRKDDEVIVCVEDFGIGISEKHQKKVFEQFYRVSGDMQHTFPGLGLGLYISSEIIKRERGRIWVTSTAGKGASFCFTLPLIKPGN